MAAVASFSVLIGFVGRWLMIFVLMVIQVFRKLFGSSKQTASDLVKFRSQLSEHLQSLRAQSEIDFYWLLKLKLTSRRERRGAAGTPMAELVPCGSIGISGISLAYGSESRTPSESRGPGSVRDDRRR